MGGLNAGGIASELYDKVEHSAVLVADIGSGIVAPQGGDELIIKGHLTQKLCVRFRSVEAVVGDGDHGGDHLVLSAA